VKQVAVVSGKGGTGKTSVVACLARIAAAQEPVVSADCDVDAANLALLLPGKDECRERFWSGRRARIDERYCTDCRECIEHCRSDAIGVDEYPAVDPLACEGCGVCLQVCPFEAVYLVENQAGVWMKRRTEYGPLVHAELGIAQDNSGKLVAHVRQEARAAAEREGIELVLVDGPPGIGCPVHAALTGCDLALVVAEPTASGEHDMERLLQLLDHFRIRAAVLINKYDLSPELADRVEAAAGRAGVPVVGRIPFLPEVPRALSRGELPTAVPEVAAELSTVWKAVTGLLRESGSV
jgi:MinD superfamily P-loop ATPase